MRTSFTKSASLAPFLALVFLSPQPNFAQDSPPYAPGPVTSLPEIYVSDFELDIAPPRMKPRPIPRPASGSTTIPSGLATTPSSSGTTPPRGVSPSPSNTPSPAPDNTAATSSSNKPATGRGSDAAVYDNPAPRANALVNAVSEQIVSALQKSGYKAQRLRAGDTLPSKGLRIRGVFAEADQRNRARRLLYGSDSGSARMILYVGVNNLATPEQPLYEVASPAAAGTGTDSKYGPVITVTSYAPATRFELSKDPTDDDLKRVAARVVADLGTLLAANPLLRTE